MPSDDNNEYFNHLNQPATPKRTRRPSSSGQNRPADFSSISDPFAEDGDATGQHPLSMSGQAPSLPGRGRERGRAVKGPGLSPGIPQQRERQPTQQIQRSGVVLTPSGVKRVEDDPPAVKQVKSTPVEPPAELPAEEDVYAESRKKNDADDVSWEEYASEDFPAMAAEEFGVKVKTTDSGRVAPVAVRSDLTDEAIKGKSVKGGGGRRPRPAKKSPAPPRSIFGKIGDSLRLSKPVLDEEVERKTKRQTKGGFAKSGSMPGGGKGGRRKKTPLGVAWSVFVEVAKILMLVLLLRAYVVQVSQVVGPSMEGTLAEGDRLIVERVTPLIANNQDKKWISWVPNFMSPEFERGDIVVVRSPEDPGSELVKRLIALPGDTIKFEEGNLYLKKKGEESFEKVEEDYLSGDELKREDGTFRSYAPTDLGGYIEESDEIEVPEARIFVLGDNRSHSNDSRRWLEIDVNRTEPKGIDRLWLHEDSIEGRVVFRIWPFENIWPPVK